MENNVDKPITEKILSENNSSSESNNNQTDNESNIMDKEKNKIEEKKNKMQEIEIEKMVLNCGGLDDKLERSVKLLKMITGKKILKTKAKKRIPGFGISPGKEAGCKVTLRDKEQINQLLRRFLAAFSNKISSKRITENHVSFGIHEYIEVPGMEYDRDIGILGFDVTLVFKRKGKRVKMKKIKKGKLPKRQQVTKQEIIDYLNKNFEAEVEEKITHNYQ